MSRSSKLTTSPVTAYPYADEDAEGNLRIVAHPVTVVPRELRGLSMADLMPAMLWSVGA